MIKTYKYKLNPNNSQLKIFEEWINTCRLIYNLTLEQKDYAYSSKKYNVSKYESYNQLPELKNEFAFIKNVYVVDGLRPVTVALLVADEVLSVPSKYMS